MSVGVVLCMIVRDESAVLARCLDSVLPVVDAACLCDTGSVDGTPELAEALLSATDLPYEVHRHEWVDFGANRDRHANIGEGTIGVDGLAPLVGHPRVRDLPLLLEVPGDGDGPRASDVTDATRLLEAGVALYS